jgi:hypothetical protein
MTVPSGQVRRDGDSRDTEHATQEGKCQRTDVGHNAVHDGRAVTTLPRTLSTSACALASLLAVTITRTVLEDPSSPLRSPADAGYGWGP